MIEEVPQLLTEAIRKSLTGREDRPTIGFYRPSLLPSCLRRQFWIYRYGLQISEERAGIFQIGHMFHGFLDQALREAGLMVKASEVPFTIIIPDGEELVRIVGRPDLIITVDGEDYIVEIKSIRRLPAQPLEHHLQQLQLYLAGYGLEKGLLVYLEKHALRHRIFKVSYNPITLRMLLGKAAALHRALLSDTPPERSAEEWECRLCEFRERCRGGELNLNEQERAA